jgi:hypothetical protein
MLTDINFMEKAMQEDSKTIKQAVEEILNEAFGDKPIPSRTAEATIIIHPRRHWTACPDRKRDR